MIDPNACHPAYPLPSAAGRAQFKAARLANIRLALAELAPGDERAAAAIRVLERACLNWWQDSHAEGDLALVRAALRATEPLLCSTCKAAAFGARSGMATCEGRRPPDPRERWAEFETESGPVTAASPHAGDSRRRRPAQQMEAELEREPLPSRGELPGFQPAPGVRPLRQRLGLDE